MIIMIHYLKGDATEPIGDGKKYIIHCCNDIGAWGSGFVLALSRKWKEPERVFRGAGRLKLGEIQFASVEDDIIVVNMCAQHGIRSYNNPKPIRYDALEECLNKVAVSAIDSDATIHGPRFGSDRAGGDWRIIEALINKCLCDKGLDVYIYNYTGA
jgi:hypothetical protein